MAKSFYPIKIIIRLLLSLKNKILNTEIRKNKRDYKYLIKHGVETKRGYVTLLGKPIIQRHSDSRIIIDEGVVLNSISIYNCAGINHPVILATYLPGSVIHIKKQCGLSGTSVVATDSIEIGEFCTIGVNVNIYDTDFHPIESFKRRNQTGVDVAKSAPVKIEKDVWIGANSTILKGVTIGEGSIISSHSLVNKDVERYSLYAGVPAKFIKKVP